MLVLTRRPGESIIIGDGIKLTVVSVGPGRVKIGIEAPTNVRINREEIHSRIQQEQQEQQEQGNDVLEGVSADAMRSHSDQNTMVSSETSIIHNRVGDKLPAEAPAIPGTSSTPTAPPTGLSKFRPPRKPR